MWFHLRVFIQMEKIFRRSRIGQLQEVLQKFEPSQVCVRITGVSFTALPQISEPLHALTQKGKLFVWTETEQEAFNSL